MPVVAQVYCNGSVRINASADVWQSTFWYRDTPGNRQLFGGPVAPGQQSLVIPTDGQVFQGGRNYKITVDEDEEVVPPVRASQQSQQPPRTHHQPGVAPPPG